MTPMLKQRLITYSLINAVSAMEESDRRIMCFLQDLSKKRMVVRYEGVLKINRADFDMKSYKDDVIINLEDRCVSLSSTILQVSEGEKIDYHIPLFQEIDVSKRDFISVGFNKSVIQALYSLDGCLIYNHIAMHNLKSIRYKEFYAKLSMFIGKGVVTLRYEDFKIMFGAYNYSQAHQIVDAINRKTSLVVKLDTPDGVLNQEQGLYGRAIIKVENAS